MRTTSQSRFWTLRGSYLNRFKQLYLLHKKLISSFQYNKNTLEQFLEATRHMIFDNDKSEKISEKERQKLANERMYFFRDYLAAIVDLESVRK